MIFSYLKYFFRAKHRKGYGVHSPFAFSFLNAVIFSGKYHDEFGKIAFLRKQLLKNNNIICIRDYGTGSRVAGDKNVSVKHLAKYSSVKHKYGKVLFECVRYVQPDEIIELGTNLGLSTLYLAMADKKIRVDTIEGCPERSSVARRNFIQLGASNIILHNEKFEQAFATVLKNNRHNKKIIFIDGNHNYSSTVTYFNMILQMTTKETVVIVDDIHWSSEMEKAWNEIKNAKKVTLTMDLFFMGIVFFNENLTQHHLTVRY